MANSYKKKKPALRPNPKRVAAAAKKVEKKRLVTSNKLRNDNLREQLDQQNNSLPIYGITQTQPAPTTQADLQVAQSLVDATLVTAMSIL